MNLDLAFAELPSPIGLIRVVASPSGVQAIHMDTDPMPPTITSEASDTAQYHANRCADQLTEYFARSRRNFELELDAPGTPFQKAVWAELCRIPYGETISYGELATRVGNPKASRAVGLANGRNPIGIIVPCHRVIGKSGALTGYAGGLDKKEILLALEGAIDQPRLR